MLSHKLELRHLLVKRLFFCINLCLNKRAFLGTSYNCCSWYLVMDLLLLHRLFGDLGHYLLPIRIIHILLLLSNKGMSGLSPGPFCAVSIILCVGGIWKVKIVLLLMAQVDIILFYLVEGLIRILHVLWRRTLNDGPSLRRNHWSCIGTKMNAILHVFEIVNLHFPIDTLFESA
jgi:hypothetical protein